MKQLVKEVKADRHCGHCHTCASELRQVLDGEEWCPKCGTYRRYKSHGWGEQGEGEWYCK
jgi:NADH pyrophosphatase NudC (nudix superfamily)